jgi:hypothetical protein
VISNVAAPEEQPVPESTGLVTDADAGAGRGLARTIVGGRERDQAGD